MPSGANPVSVTKEGREEVQLNAPGELPGWAIPVIALAIVVQLSLQVYAFVRLVKTPDDRLTARKWVWGLIILAGEMVGAIIFLAAGRKPAEAVDPLAAYVPDAPAAGDRAARAADVLYGSGSDAQ